jgi:hypothetical protein
MFGCSLVRYSFCLTHIRGPAEDPHPRRPDLRFGFSATLFSAVTDARRPWHDDHRRVSRAIPTEQEREQG